MKVKVILRVFFYQIKRVNAFCFKTDLSYVYILIKPFIVKFKAPDPVFCIEIFPKKSNFVNSILWKNRINLYI